MQTIEILKSFQLICPTLTWDRFVDTGHDLVYYGWIQRKDKQRDFLVIYFTPNCNIDEVGFITSSAKYSETFAGLSGSVHTKCQKVNL